MIDILFNFSQQIAKVASITNADEMKSVYLPNSVCQLINEILANLLYSTEDIDCVQSILEIYSSLIKVFGEIWNVKFKALFIQELTDQAKPDHEKQFCAKSFEIIMSLLLLGIKQN